MLINQRSFRAMEDLGDDIFEVNMSHGKVSLNLPIQIGVMILHHAKLRMLQFVYDFLFFYIDRTNITFCEMDTDSIYFAIAGENITDVIIDKLKGKFTSLLNQNCTNVRDLNAFLPRTCCEEHAFDDSKHPGLFKKEWSGIKMLCLASKTYVGITEDNKVKLTCKGANKEAIRKNDPFELFKSVLLTKKQVLNVNRGFRVNGAEVVTYAQSKRCFPYLYIKREILADGVSSRTLDIVLNPTPIDIFCIQREGKFLCMTYNNSFTYRNKKFRNILQAYIYFKAVNCGSEDRSNEILNAHKEYELWSLEREIKNNTKWDSIKYLIMKDIVSERISGNECMQKELRDTGEQGIYSASACESYFNCGLNKNVLRWINTQQIPGSNYYGKILMCIRSKGMYNKSM